MLRAVLSGEEAKSLLKLQTAHYTGLEFPKMTPDRKADFAVMRIFETELHGEWRAGYYCFEADVDGIEVAIQTCTAKLPVIGGEQTKLHPATI